jgi:DNA repair protein RadC
MIMESTNEKELFEVAEIQLTYKSRVKASLRPKITGSKDVYDVLKKYWDEDKIEFVEQFKVLLLNRANKVIGIYEVSSGTTTGTVADPKSIFVAALKGNACVVILIIIPQGISTPARRTSSLRKIWWPPGNFFTFQYLIMLS